MSALYAGQRVPKVRLEIGSSASGQAGGAMGKTGPLDTSLPAGAGLEGMTQGLEPVAVGVSGDHALGREASISGILRPAGTVSGVAADLNTFSVHAAQSEGVVGQDANSEIDKLPAGVRKELDEAQTGVATVHKDLNQGGGAQAHATFKGRYDGGKAHGAVTEAPKAVYMPSAESRSGRKKRGSGLKRASQGKPEQSRAFKPGDEVMLLPQEGTGEAARIGVVEAAGDLERPRAMITIRFQHASGQRLPEAETLFFKDIQHRLTLKKEKASSPEREEPSKLSVAEVLARLERMVEEAEQGLDWQRADVLLEGIKYRLRLRWEQNRLDGNREALNRVLDVLIGLSVNVHSTRGLDSSGYDDLSWNFLESQVEALETAGRRVVEISVTKAGRAQQPIRQAFRELLAERLLHMTAERFARLGRAEISARLSRGQAIVRPPFRSLEELADLQMQFPDRELEIAAFSAADGRHALIAAVGGAEAAAIRLPRFSVSVLHSHAPETSRGELSPSGADDDLADVWRDWGVINDLIILFAPKGQVQLAVFDPGGKGRWRIVSGRKSVEKILVQAGFLNPP